MLYPSINELRKKVDSKYTLVALASKRARDLIDEKPALTENAESDKPVTIAAQEIYEELITYNRDNLDENGDFIRENDGEYLDEELTEEDAPGYVTLGEF